MTAMKRNAQRATSAGRRAARFAPARLDLDQFDPVADAHTKRMSQDGGIAICGWGVTVAAVMRESLTGHITRRGRIIGSACVAIRCG